MTYSFKAPADSTEVRFREAVRDIRAAGVKWYANRISCCGSCAGGELATYMESKGLDTDTAPVAWTFKGHGYIQWMEDGELAATSYSSYYRKMVKEHAAASLEVTINHDNGAAEIVRDAFMIHGFEVDWDGSDFKCVTLTIPHKAAWLTAETASDGIEDDWDDALQGGEFEMSYGDGSTLQ